MYDIMVIIHNDRNTVEDTFRNNEVYLILLTFGYLQSKIELHAVVSR